MVSHRRHDERFNPAPEGMRGFIRCRFAGLASTAQARVFEILILLAACFSSSNAGEWGSLSGRFVAEGDVSKPLRLEIERDAEVCGKSPVFDESLIVNAENSGLRNVIIWLESRTAVPVHPDAVPIKDTLCLLDNIQCRFEPRVQSVLVNQQLLLRNSDPVPHNAAVYLRRSTPFNEVIPVGGEIRRQISKPETQPVQVDCSIHPWMKAWLLILEHPYAVVTDEDGQFELTNVPAGEWKFRFWHERAGFIGNVTREGQPVAISNGSWTLLVPENESRSLGTLSVSADTFMKKRK